uniref:Cytochrome c oxidase subunit 2 n=1 Tax=Amblyseius hainanensis TaxID=3061184 RepID=A0AAU6PBL9_9ACAR
MYLMESNSPVMEQLILFHDYSMMIMLAILIFLMLSILDLLTNKKINLFLMENQSVELVWTIIPMFLLIFIAAPSLRLLYLMEESFSPSITLKVIGHQWYWCYMYNDFTIQVESFMMTDEFLSPDSFRLLETDSPLILPYQILTRILLTSVDVIHSWTIQSLGVKMDAIPGRLNQMSIFPLKPGVFFGQCSEICGTNHSFMPITLWVTNMNHFLKMIK